MPAWNGQVVLAAAPWQGRSTSATGQLMALAREMVATAAADAPYQVVEPAADPDQPLPQMAQKSAAVI